MLKSINSPKNTIDKVGTASKKLNLAASDFVKPKARAASIVTADLDDPGIKAKIWVPPINKESFKET